MFRIKGGGSGSGGNSFTTIQTDAGTSPNADSSTDTLTLTSSDGSILITGNSTTDTVDFQVTGSGTGDVTGPASSTDNALARFDSTTGKMIQNSVATLSDAGLLSTANVTVTSLTPGSILFAGTGGAISEDNTNFYWDNANDRLAIGQNTTNVKVNSNSLEVKLTIDSSGGTEGITANFHKHATTTESLIYQMRSRGTSAAPTIVQNSDVISSLIGAAYTGNATVGYQEAAGLYFEVSSSGTVSTTSMPGTIKLKVTPDGSVTMATALEIASNKTVTMSAYGAGFAKFSAAGLISSSTIASTDISDFAEAVDDRVDTLIQDGTGLAWTYNDGANTLTGNVSLSAFSTTNLSEGTNLYYTDERVDDRVAVLIQNGTGISWVYSDAGGTLTPTVSLAAFSTTNLSEGSNLYFTDERAQDAVGTILTDSSSIDFTYTDGSNQITAAVLPAGVDHDSLLNFVANEHINHTSVSIATSSTSGLSGGGDISTTRNLVVAPNLATAATVASGDIILIADVDDSNNLKRTTAGAIAALGGGGGMSIGGTVTSGTATRVLFVDTGPVLADDAGFTFNKTSNVATLSGGLSGGSANTDNLTIYANDTAYVDNTTGSILIKHRMKFAESFTAVGSGGALNERFIDLTSTVTSSLIINIFTGYTHRPDVLVSVGQILSSAPAFQAAPNFTHTAVGLTDTLTYYSGFDSVPRIDTDAASGTSTLGYLYGYNARPAISKTGAATMVAPLVVGFTTFSSPLIGVTDWASGPTVTEYNAFRSYEPVASGCNVTNYYGFKYITPATVNKPTITNEFAYASDIASGSAKWNLYFTGTGKSFMQGGLRIGDSSPAQPTEKLEVNGNVVITNGQELRFYDSGDSNYVGFEAPALSANKIWVLPNADGSANQVLKTDGSGNLGWSTVSGSNHNLLDGSVHPDTLAGTVVRGDVIVGNSTPKWARLAKGTAYQVLSMDSSATDVAWANHTGFQISGSTATVSGTATVVLNMQGIATCEHVMPFAGMIYAISIGTSANRTAGTLTARYTKNGSADTTNTAVIDGTNVRRFYRLFTTPVTFAAGDYLTLETVTSGFTPTTNDAIVTLFCMRT